MKHSQIAVISFKRNILITSLFLLLSILCLYTWANLAPLESASIAPGFVRAEGQNQKIEHLFGGKVESININNGDLVKKGDILIVLDNKETKTGLTARLNEYLTALAQRDVANAMLNAEKSVAFNKATTVLANRLNKNDVLNVQNANFNTTRQVRIENEQLLQSKINQIRSAITTENIRLNALNVQLNLASKQLDSYNKLVSKKHIARLQIVDLEKEISQLKGKIAAGQNLIIEKKLAIDENKLRIAHLLSEEKQQAAMMLADIEDSIPTLQAQIIRMEQNIEESLIKAPVAGIITDLNISSVGETVKSGEELMKILPEEDNLIIEARLNTADIESIQEGQKARVRLTAYNFRSTPMLDANVAKISADRMQDELGYFYQLQLVIAKSELAQYPEISLAAGMPAEGIIINDKRTVMEYLLEPIKRGINRSLRES